MAAAAAVVLIAVGAVALSLVNGRSSDQLVTSPTVATPPAMGPSTTVPAVVGFEVLAVESTDEPTVCWHRGSSSSARWNRTRRALMQRASTPIAIASPHRRTFDAMMSVLQPYLDAGQP